MKPILFNTDMVRAILDNRKTVTRRVVKPQPRYSLAQMPLGPHKGEWHEYNESSLKDPTITSPWGYQYTPPYRPGDILYVRETWRIWKAHRYDADAHIEFKAGGEGTVLRFPNGCTDSVNRKDYDDFIGKWGIGGKWHPSIHMPRKAARIFLRVTDVRVERLQDITQEQAEKEGAQGWLVAGTRDWDKNPNFIASFRYIWNHTAKKADRALYGWAANPWVWAIEFERIGREGAQACQ